MNGKLSSSTCMDQSMSEIQNIPTLKYYISGIDEIAAL